MSAIVAPARANPMFAEQDALKPAWTRIDSMPMVARYGTGDAQAARVIGVGDLSARRRCGFKGAGTAAWLTQQGLPIPAQPNAWLELPSGAGSLIARLGRTEFMIEDAQGGTQCAALERHSLPARVYPVLRQDAELVLTGERSDDLLLQVCSVEFAALDRAARPAVLTSMVGVGVTVIACPPGPAASSGGAWRYRIWCDGTYSAYLWSTLVEIARELGGGPIGLEALGP